MLPLIKISNESATVLPMLWKFKEGRRRKSLNDLSSLEELGIDINKVEKELIEKRLIDPDSKILNQRGLSRAMSIQKLSLKMLIGNLSEDKLEEVIALAECRLKMKYNDKGIIDTG